ncbi:hypothetical protein PCH70_39120 [Pseudomonas cichorii JBC1]|nr:hypothetical protein PCH70_39120 [Pseudomonas cichorii JBC1]
MRVLPDEKSEACEENKHQADGDDTCDNHIVQKHNFASCSARSMELD